MSVELFRVVLPVADMHRAVAFYSKVLAMSGQSIAPTRYYFPCGDTILALVDPAGHERPFQANPDLLYFAVDDLEATLARVREAAAPEMDEAIAVQPWGERSFYARDPFGNPICFVDRSTKFTGRASSLSPVDA